MKAKAASNALLVLVLVAAFVSVGILYVRTVVKHDYEVLYLTEEETAEFLEESAVEEDAESEELANPLVDDEIVESEESISSEEPTLPPEITGEETTVPTE